jgi:hypothetical protein
MVKQDRVFSSFRDPAGFVYNSEGQFFRQINLSYSEIYDEVINCGLFDSLIEKNWLLPFEEDGTESFKSDDGYKIIKPLRIPFVSYPYEWSFSQIKDAALLTLDIHLAALQKGLLLKDASSYNIQFYKGRPIFIDHLSFDLSDRYGVWPAYGQFCRHFLAPLVLMSRVNIQLGQLYRLYLDGVPLDLATAMLPAKNRLNPGLLMHLYLHARSQNKYADQGNKLKESQKLTSKQLISIARSLRNTVKNISWKPSNTEWGDYYTDTNYNDVAMTSKKEIVSDFLQQISPKKVWDLGGNIGVMSRLALQNGAHVLSFDIDPAAVEKNYLQCKEENERNLLPLIMDFNNPSPDIGFACRERDSLTTRGPADLLLALALIHHLSISNNLPFIYLSEYFSSLGNWLIIEFVPKKDSQVQRLLTSREDIFVDYTEDYFEASFSNNFSIIKKERISESDRIVYLMRKA